MAKKKPKSTKTASKSAAKGAKSDAKVKAKAKPASEAKARGGAKATPAKAAGAKATNLSETAPRRPARTPEIVTTLSHDEIARRAYEIWVRKGRPLGHDEENWRQAEQELAAAKA
jgi:cytoskeletal protein RodZ